MVALTGLVLGWVQVWAWVRVQVGFGQPNPDTDILSQKLDPTALGKINMCDTIPCVLSVLFVY